MPESLPLVSIVTPSYNQAPFLEQTILSVLTQDYPNLEYLVADGNSTDGSVEIIRKYAHRLAWWTSEPDRGQAEAINKGFRHAKGEIVGWVNSDDLYFHSRVIRQAVEAFRDHPEAGMVYADGLKINREGYLIDWFRYPQYSLKDLLGFNILLQPASFMRREALQAGGFLPLESNLTLDQELWIRIAARYPLIHVEGFWGVERSHENAKTFSLAARYGPDAFQLVDSLRRDPLFAPTIEQSFQEIYAGLHVFSARRLIDAEQPGQALRQFWLGFRLSAPVVSRVWYKVLQALGGALGLGSLFLSYRDLRRRLSHPSLRLMVDDTGVHWAERQPAQQP
jgi:hypothetical protein